MHGCGPSPFLAGHTSFRSCTRPFWRGPTSLIRCTTPCAACHSPSTSYQRQYVAGHSPSSSVRRRERPSRRRYRRAHRHPRAVTRRLGEVTTRTRAAHHRLRSARDERRRADTESWMSVAVAGLHDSKSLLHECVHRLHASVGRARLNVRPIDCEGFPEEAGKGQFDANESRPSVTMRRFRVQNVCAEHCAFFDATPAGAKTRAIFGTHFTPRVRGHFNVLPRHARQPRSEAAAHLSAKAVIGAVSERSVYVTGKLTVTSARRAPWEWRR